MLNPTVEQRLARAENLSPVHVRRTFLPTLLHSLPSACCLLCCAPCCPTPYPLCYDPCSPGCCPVYHLVSLLTCHTRVVHFETRRKTSSEACQTTSFSGKALTLNNSEKTNVESMAPFNNPPGEPHWRSPMKNPREESP